MPTGRGGNSYPLHLPRLFADNYIKRTKIARNTTNGSIYPPAHIKQNL